ncbi:MAG TPA: hypothetical protein VER35_02685 [Candidatus Limnocylindrales bacterium]|nr:hypothetical protein [Candidatus Limnocylindrales bacterium]
MSFAEFKKLRELLKKLQGSGAATTRNRMEVGRVIEKIQTERSAARMMADADVSQPLGLLESSFEKSSLLGERWKPPWDSTWNLLPDEEFLNAPQILNPRAFDINLHRGASHALTELESPGGKYSGLNERTKNILANKLNYRMKLEESYAGAIRGGDSTEGKAIRKKIETLDESIYRMGATEWDAAKDIPEEWKDTLKAYSKRDLFEEMSWPYFTGGYVPGDLGSNLLSFKDPKIVLNKAAVFTQKQWRDREAAQEELQFINNYLSNPQTAQDYAKNAPLSFFKYWSEKGGMLGLQEHMKALKAVARSEDEELFKAKWGALTTVKDVKTRNFAFASLRGKVTELWDPTSPKISQVGLFQDATGEKIKFTIWNNQQQNVQKVEAGKNYYFGNVASQEWQGRWNLNINKQSVLDEIKPTPFDTAPPLIVPGRKVELRDYSKPYSIDPIKGTITYTTKSGKVVEMPIQEADMAPLKKIRLGDERGDMAAFLPFAGIPFFQDSITGGTAQIDSQQATRRNAGEQVIETLGGAYDDINILGSIWYQKASEANERIKARDAAASGAKFGNFSLAWANTKYQMAQLPWNVLDVLGGALYPLSYPGQALWGELSGIGAMEGIRKETRASEVLDIDNPLASLAVDTILDPVNLIGIGAVTKTKKLARGIEMFVTKPGFKSFLANDFGELGKSPDLTSWGKAGMSRSAYVKKLLSETPDEEWKIDRLMAEYNARPMSAATKSRLEELSSKSYNQLSMSERSELDDLIFQDTFLGDNMPKAPISFAQDAAQIVPKPPNILKTAQTETDRISEKTVEEIIARRESRVEITTPEQIKQIRELQRKGIKETADYQARNTDKTKFSWVNLGLGVGAGIAATSSFYSLPKEEQEANKEQVSQALMPSEEQGILGTAVDILNMDCYIEGATILNAQAMLTGDAKRYDWKDRITPSMALGIQTKDTSLFSMRGAAGTVLDIAAAPTTYLSLGSGAAVKIGSVGGKGAKALKLSKTGVKELSTFTKKYGEEMGTLEFAHHIEQNPAFQKKVLAAGGVNLRGWGQEVNLIPGSVFDPVTNAAKTGAMQFSLEHPTAFKKAVGMQEYLEDKFVVRAAVKRLPRSSRLLPMEADYAEKAMLLPKKVRFDIAQGTERDIELAKEARKAFGENYEEIVSDLIEAPVTRESAKLTKEQQAIIEEIEGYNKGFAAQEKELGLLGIEMSGYLRHTLTPEAKKYLEKGGKKVSTELYTPLSVENKFTTKRTLQGTVSAINERARKELGVDFDYFEANPFKATSIRRAESVQAVEQAKLLKWTVEKYGVPEEVARSAPGEYVQSSVYYIKGVWLPKPIAEDIEKKFVPRETGAALQLYDKALNAWKYGATVTHPAYHASNVVGGIFNNWLAEVDPISYYRSSRLLLGGDKEKVFTTALGEEYSGQELLKMAGESGILSQPGMMDIQKLSYEIADTQKEKALELAKKGANSPITAAQYEENFIRFSLFNDRIMKGDTIQGARSWVSEFQFQYSKESFTSFERDYMKRAVPFYAWMRGNVPLMGKQFVKSPGKFAQFGKLNVAAVNGQELPQYTEGDLTWMYPWDESTGTFNYMRTPATDLDAYSDPWRYGFSALTPFAKYPLEKGLGFNTYTGKDFDTALPWYNPQNSAESNLIVGRTGRDVGTLSDIYEDRNAGKQGIKYLSGVGQAKTDIRKNSDTEIRDAYRKYTGRPNDFTYEQRLALMQRDKWASAQSGISGEFEQLQGGHVYPAVLGGPPLPWNYITQTREENLEWLSAQNYIENLPEREIQQEEAWGRVSQEYSTGVEEINTRTLDTRGRPENEAQKEKKRYDLRKSANIKIYNRQLNSVRSAIRSSEKDLRGEKKKVEYARAKGYSDPASEAQIKVIEAVLIEHRALYEKVSGLRDAEQGKEYELPVQGTDLSRFQPMDIGDYDKYTVRYGRGKELASLEDIEKLVDLKKIAAYYAAMKSYAPVAGFSPGTPEEVKNRILFTRDPRYQELAQIANPLISAAGWEGISGKNYIGPRNISEIRAVVEGSESETEPVIGLGEPQEWYSDQQVSQEPGQAAGFDYDDPEFREVVREIIQETLSEGIVSD